MQTDANQLVNNSQRGDKAAAIELVKLYYERIYAFLRRLCGSVEDAEDLTQHTFARVWQSLPRFEGRSSVTSWIHSIAYHVYVDWRRVDHASERRSDEWWSDRPAPQDGPDTLAARNDLAAVLYATVDRLDPDVRDTVHLRYYQGLTIEETAAALGVATSTVKYRLRQALDQLQRQFGPRATSQQFPSPSGIL
jgi:RNA polymerase sigma-70 factor (ECF subfamily)